MQLIGAPGRRLPAAVAVLALAGAVVAGTGARAWAYPQFQFSTGNGRCSMCHFSPVGGGLINRYGRFEASDDISLGGNGGFLNGLWTPPSWLALGADLRGAVLAQKNSTEPRYAVFPMQADLYTVVHKGAWFASATFGLRGEVRTPTNPLVDRLVSREHYIMWRPKNTGPYVRIGRFFAPYGLRIPDHTAYIRRYLGMGNFEETYGVSGGWVEKGWELHATAFVPAPIWSSGPAESGGAVYYERRVGDRGAYGVQARAGIASNEAHYFGGAVGKWYLKGAKILALGEVDLGEQTFAATASPSRSQLAAYLGLTYFPVQGLMIGVAAERYDEDLSVSNTARDSLNLTLQFFPRAHWELMLMGKIDAKDQNAGNAAELGLLMLHYYL